MKTKETGRLVGTKQGTMKEITFKPPYALYVAGVFLLIYSFALPFYRLSDWLIAVGATLIIYTVADKFVEKFVKPKKKLVPYNEKIEYSGNETADELIKSGYQLLEEIKIANDALSEENISKQLDRIEVSCTKILKQLTEKPQNSAQLRKFFVYYLPTVSKLLKAQITFESQGIEGENIKNSKEKIVEILTVVATAFENQLDSLFADVALDINAETAVLEGMLQSEGLTDTAQNINLNK